MNSNRAINDSVVEARFRENLDQLAETGRFKDFGQINLLILLNDPEHVFYVMDGQHRSVEKAGDMYTQSGTSVDLYFFRVGRSDTAWFHDFIQLHGFFLRVNFDRCRVMERLHRHTNRDIKFQFRAKAVFETWRKSFHTWLDYPCSQCLSRSFKVFYLLFGWWTMCGCFVLSGTIGSCIFLSPWFFLSGLETRSSLQKTTTPHQHNAKKLQDEAEAHQELLHFQNAYPSDPRAFFSTRRARQVGTSVLQRLRTKFPSREREWVMWVASVYCTGVQKRVQKKKVWIVFMLSMLLVFFFNVENTQVCPVKKQRKVRKLSCQVMETFQELWVDVTTFRAGKRTGDPNRPKLNDFLIFWLLQDSQLLGAETLAVVQWR